MELFARALAEANSDEQAAFINAFAAHLLHGCPSHYKHESQLCYIADALSPAARQMVKSLAAFLELSAQRAAELREAWTPAQAQLDELNAKIEARRKELEELEKAAGPF